MMKKIYLLENLDCANCAAKMEDAVGKIDGVESVSINFLTQKMVLRADENLIEDIFAQAEKAMKKIEPDVEVKPKA